MSLKGKIYCSTGYNGVVNWILPLGFEITTDIQQADVVAFAGGADIDTSFYGEQRGKFTGKSSNRDILERRDFLIAQERGIKTVGICRGAQLVCALSGGKLIQHVNNHGGEHAMYTSDGYRLRVNSMHHQMMFPYQLDKKDYKILGWCARPISTTYLDGNNKERWLPQAFKECEIVKFNRTNSLGIQFHPEMMHRAEHYRETNHWLGNLFLKFYENGI